MEAGACDFSVQKLGVNSYHRDDDGTPMITDTMSEEDLMPFARVLKETGAGRVPGDRRTGQDVGGFG